jgi:hypothetical protein
VRRDASEGRLYLRVRRTIRSALLEISAGGRVMLDRRYSIVTPPEMVTAPLPRDFDASAGAAEILVRVLEE